MSHSVFLRFGRHAAGAGLLALASACASTNTLPPAETYVSQADRHKVSFSAVDESLDLPVTAASVGLDDQARAALADFAAAYRGGGGRGALDILRPTGAGNSIAAQVVANEARDFLAAQGIHPVALVVAPYDAAGQSDAPLLLTFSRTIASVPDCPKVWQDDLSKSPNNLPWSSFGCATVSNIAALVADPNDLRQPREMTAADAARRQTIIDKYRKGETTHALRSSSERVTVSTAVR
jgi:pilus assembly protein CpaD